MGGNSVSEKNNRIVWLDQARAVSMFLVVLGHAASVDWLVKYLYAFHMPLFFIISGMTFNPNRYDRFFDRVKDKFNKLVIPHFWMNLLMLPLWIFNWKVLSSAAPNLIELIKGVFYINSAVYQTPSNATWFLAALFLTDIMFYLVWKWSKGENRFLIISVCILGLVGFIESINKSNYEGPWHIEATFTGLVFYMLGYLFRQHLPAIESWVKDKKQWLLLCLGLFVIGTWCATTNGRVSMNGNSYDSILYFYTGAICLSFLVILVVMKLPAIHPLSYIGQNTIAYVGIHIPLIRLFQKLFPIVTTIGRYSCLLAVVVYLIMVPIVWIINRFFPFIVAKKQVHRDKLTLCVTILGITVWLAATISLIHYVLP